MWKDHASIFCLLHLQRMLFRVFKSSEITCFLSFPSRSALCDPQAHGWPIQYLLCICPHQTQPAHPQGSHQPGHRGSHPLHVLAALLLHTQIRYFITSISLYYSFSDRHCIMTTTLSVTSPLTLTGPVHPITLFTLVSLLASIALSLFRLCLRKQPNKSTSYQVSSFRLHWDMAQQKKN